MDIIKIIAVAIVSTVLVMLIKQQRPELAILISIGAVTIILLVLANKIADVITLVNTFATKAGIDSNFISLILKVTAIAYITEFGANICKDAGDSSLSSKVELAGKITIVALSIPVMMSLLDLLLTIMPE